MDTTKSPAASVSTRTNVLALRIVEGLHEGALTPLAETAILVIGASDDCDVILADTGVASHHCIVTSQDGKLTLRAMEGVLTCNGGQQAPGTAVPITPRARVSLGTAAFEIVPDVSIEGVIPRTLGASARHAQVPRGWSDHAAKILRRFRWGIGAGVVALVAVACALRPVSFGRARPAHSPGDAAQVVDAAARRPGEAVAHDVAEVLRLSGIACKAQYTGDGAVTVTGRLGDPKALATVIQSRAMREIVGLKRVVAVNIDHPGGSAWGTSVDGTRIVSVIASEDPYVVTADGSRYYVGASLPQGGRLTGVKSGEVLVERNGRVEHWKLPETRSGG